ncbi:MAG: beta-ketoacyl-ACP synthase III [Lysobacteraceae bacterium]
MSDKVFARIAGTGSYLPEKCLTNDELATFVETSDEWIRERTGIRQRHLAAEGETTCDLAEHASRRALEAAGVDASELDLIVVGTTTPDIIFPSTACLLQHRLGANGIAAFDVNAACSGFVYALSVADQFIRAGTAKKVLVVGAETLSRMLDWSDRGTCVLFGDGAGAVVLTADSETGILSTHLHADGGKKELLYNPVGVSVGFKPEEKNAGVRVLMTGNEVFKHAVKALDSVVDETLDANGLGRGDIDWLIPHQANLRIIQATAKRLAMPMERVVVTVDRHGNTSAGSVPLALDEAVRSGRVQRGQLLLLEAFGGGFTWGSALLRY